jgi:hypothetical protein
MILGINQPTFFPWLGFFNFLQHSEKFVFLDNVQSVKQSFIVRNKILNPDGKARWITAELAKHSLQTHINKVRFFNHTDWFRRTQRKIIAYYRNAPYFNKVASILFYILNTPEDVLSEYNIRTINLLYDWIFNESLDYIRASEIPGSQHYFNSPLERVMHIIDKLGDVSTYLNSKSGIERGLYPVEIFKAKGITLMKQEYNCVNYHQTTTEFQPGMSIIDLMVNEPQKRWKSIIMRGSCWYKLC